ncbi:hypothetical protein GW943_00160 [Candidatus Parcubacteria bacterium]|uniref:Uncharacterized protein n=1 Tax=Candidatus Kaiserbacteria bacterium CG10_big_fil_rev_8_21_14_0_10_47_16 TaxID=1974608 RepID=A0A2H0UCW4_9BACT|nr:hypothetical protein [Candidatus Parcubacteria bacterium]PIR84263.1 MAG: hypothetical protein COU16_01540 [Candidatus Kaiserbacteria bacterium CG10_big_fil_rev_8_21_14_0_10_47_16]
MQPTRRQLLAGIAAVAFLPRFAFAADDHAGVGTLDKGTFLWTNGGGNPFKGTLDQAMELAGIPADMRPRISAAVAHHPKGHDTYELRDGDPVGTMVFTRKKHWVAKETVAMPSKWKSKASRIAAVWYVNDETGVQYRIIKPLVCGNWSFARYGAPLPCRCEPSKGDAC